MQPRKSDRPFGAVQDIKSGRTSDLVAQKGTEKEVCMKIYVTDNDESVITFKDEDGTIRVLRGKKVKDRTMSHVRLEDGKTLESETTI